MSNSIQGSGSNEPSRIKSMSDIENLQKSNPDLKNAEQLKSIFSRMDADHNGTIDENEGSLYYFNDGAITGKKGDKLVTGASASGNIYDFENANVKVTNKDNASTTEYVYKSDKNEYSIKNEVQYKKYTKDGKQYILSPNNKKLATIEADGSYRTSFQLGDSFEGTMIRLGLDPLDADIRKAMEEANPNAAKRGYFTLDDNGGSGTQVSIPTSVLEKYDVNYNGPTLRFAPKTESKD